MANITASMVKELREMTGAGMMECKKALAEAEGDMEKAVDVLRTRGLAAVAKKAGRATNEGTVMAIVNDACTTGAVVELNCETDFVGMNEKFKAYAEKIAKAALAAKPADVEALKAEVQHIGVHGGLHRAEVAHELCGGLGNESTLFAEALRVGDAMIALIGSTQAGDCLLYTSPSPRDS